MALTFLDLVNRCKQQLSGYTKNQDQFSWLAQSCLATDTTLQANPSTVNALSRGIAEVEDELLYITKYDTSTGLVTIAAGTNGRGVLGTTAASHNPNALIVADPDFPRARIKEAINDTIRQVYPDLWVFGQYDFPKVAARYQYDIPSDVEQIYKVTADTIGPSRVWFPVQEWRYTSQPSTADSPNGSLTGKQIYVGDSVVPGRSIHVVYQKAPNTLVNNTDDYATTTGLLERTYDVVMYGACARMLQAYEPARLQQKAIESTQRAPLVPAGSSTQAAQYYWNLYSRRLAEEQEYLHTLHAEYQHFTG